MINYIVSNMNREVKCPFYGTYNWTRDFNVENKNFTFVPPFVRRSSEWWNKTVLVRFTGELWGAPERGREEYMIKILYFFQAIL